MSLADSCSADMCPPALVRDELRRVLSSSSFTTSDRNRRFLEYVIEETLAGRATRLKAYNIATTVFGRPDSFDPQIDPVVRMEAGRLRRALERFYLLEGNAVSVHIAMPKGGYVPEFRTVGAPAENGQAGEPATTDGPPSVIVAPFEPEGDPTALLNLNVGFTRQLMIDLHQLGDCVVCDPQLAAGRASEARRGVAVRNGDCILTGDVAIVGDALSVTALLLDASTGRVLWGKTFQRTVTRGQGILALRDEVADCVAHALHEYLCGRPETGRGDRPSAATRVGQQDRAERTPEESRDPDAHPLSEGLQYLGPFATH
jgi:adenylate cyclase